ncbi:MAG: biotin/lipoate A/B protein ligase family protein [bacterium]
MWRLIDSGAGLASENMAIDEAILKSCELRESPPTLHFYTWKTPSISLGYFQDFSDTVKVNECLVKGIQVVRRITGGRAVVHHKDVSFSLIFPAKGGIIPPGISSSYRMIAQGLIEGLRSLGIMADISDNKRFQNGFKKEERDLSACFLTRIRFEVMVSGRKLLGFAQRRIGDWVLLQGTIMIDLDRSLWTDFLYYPDSLDSHEIIDRLRSEITSVNEVLGKQDDIVLSMKKALLKGLSKVLGIRFAIQGLGFKEWTDVDRLAGYKYRDLLGKSPGCPSRELYH